MENNQRIINFINNQVLVGSFESVESGGYRLTDIAPEWLRDLCNSVTRELEADYRTIVDLISDVIDLIDEADEGDLEEHLDNWNASVYNSELLAWVGAHSSHASYVTDEMEEYVDSSPRSCDFYTLIQQGQYAMYRDVAYRTLEWFENNIDELDEEVEVE